ncbi:hypothetical protein [Cellulophaga tyrosinoxydans]|uniref:Calx-beta domain-containing protein n=1 Tax=Cellulophaga tyrosinoxydans TaxID=504486 RepID=A0A1W2AN97_9FLAO|nr:hypothetical protein [Cellulophaga tyrosinoxydans]SMC61708.1 hypothetical protein SAMN05660703_2043 [Cellulophaga tyrosinoxydans]
MKNIINKFNVLACIVLTTMFISCDAILDQDETDFGKGPILAQFESPKGEINIIKDPTVTSIDYEIPITFFGGLNVPLDRDVQVTIATSPNSAAKEGVEFELTTTTFTIPAGQKVANASIKILPANLVAFDFKDIVLEITDSSESVSDNNTFALTVKALDANTLAGTYTVEEGLYSLRAGTPSSFAGRKVVISAISPGLYAHPGIGPFDGGGTYYFTVDDATGFITILPNDLEGEPTLLNGSPIMTCAGGQFEKFTCDNTTNKATLMPNGKHIVETTTGYFRGVGQTREFYERLVRD